MGAIPSKIKYQGMIKKGMLLKKMDTMRTWKERWFVLENGELSYFMGKFGGVEVQEGGRGELRS